MRREVWLLPLPVRTAPTEMIGLLEANIVRRGFSSRKPAPAASTREARCMTVSCDTSLYENTTSSTSCRAISCSSSASGWMGIPCG